MYVLAIHPNLIRRYRILIRHFKWQKVNLFFSVYKSVVVQYSNAEHTITKKRTCTLFIIQYLLHAYVHVHTCIQYLLHAYCTLCSVYYSINLQCVMHCVFISSLACLPGLSQPVFEWLWIGSKLIHRIPVTSAPSPTPQYSRYCVVYKRRSWSEAKRRIRCLWWERWTRRLGKLMYNGTSA